MNEMILSLDVSSFIKGFFYSFWMLGKNMVSKKELKQSNLEEELDLDFSYKPEPKVKIAFEIVELEVDRLFSNPLEDNETVDDRILSIERYIEACGWSMDDYDLRKQFGELN